MYKPNSEQQSRIEAMSQWVNQNIPVIWEFEKQLIDNSPLWFSPHIANDPIQQSHYQHTITQLSQNFDEQALILHLADYYLFPAENPPQARNAEKPLQHATTKCFQACLTHYFAQLETFDSNTTEAVMKRIQYILQHPEDDKESDTYSMWGKDGYFEPDISALCELATQKINLLESETEWQALCKGDWKVDLVEDGEVWSNSYEENQYQLTDLLWKGIADHLRVNQFSYDDFRTLIMSMPWLFPAGHLGKSVDDDGSESEPQSNLLSCLQWGYTPTAISPADMQLFTTLQEYTKTLAAEIVNDHSEANASLQAKILETMEYVVPDDKNALVKACTNVEKQGLKAKQVHDEYGDKRGLRYLMRTPKIESKQDEAELVAALKHLHKDTLWMAFPHCSGARKAVLMALGAECLIPLHETVSGMVSAEPYGNHFTADNFYNSEEVEGQIIDQQALGRALHEVPVPLIKRYLKELKASQLGYTDIAKFVEAYLGLNQAAIEKSLVRHMQSSLKAYGLLPIESEQDAQQRYIALKKAWKEASQYGAERQANTRAAAEIGLHHLAIRAGYPDPIRMEWDLEAVISEGAKDLFTTRTIEQWEVKLGLEGLKPVLNVSKQGKALKSTPTGLRKTDEYKEYKAVMEKLKEQARRFRLSLENMMIGAEPLSRPDLEKLTKIPAMQYLLANLIGINSNNECGLINHESMKLTNGDKQYPIGDAIRIAHVHDLFTHKVLSHWQQQVVQQQIVQPFKQVFRELYILTPAERESATYTNRFTQRTVDTAIAYRLLQARGWSMYEQSVTKQQSNGKIGVNWSFPEVHHFFTEDSMTVSDTIQFNQYQSAYGYEDAMNLADVPAIFFSECLRDADLVVSVAFPRNQTKKDGFWSYEVQQHRISVAKHIAENLGIKDLRFDDKSVYVTGQWNEYRIHLGNANTYLGKKHLCIGPDNDKGNNKKVYLPFADTDSAMSEIVAKIILLRNDSKIKDATILEQICPQTAEA